VATNGKEYKSIQDWFYSELYPRLPKHGVSVAKDVITICNIANYIRMTESIVTIFTQSSGDVFQ
jgi:hypothetical protein